MYHYVTSYILNRCTCITVYHVYHDANVVHEYSDTRDVSMYHTMRRTWYRMYHMYHVYRVYPFGAPTTYLTSSWHGVCGRAAPLGGRSSPLQ